jgi:hypothetical protein
LVTVFFWYSLKGGSQRFLEGHGLGSDDVHQRAALDAGEYLAVDFLAAGIPGQDQSSPGAPQGFVGGGCDHVTVWE